MIPPVNPFRLHRRQFVIGPRPLAPFDDWRTVELGDGLVLSHDPALPVVRAGRNVLLGTVLPTDAARPDPLGDLHADTIPADVIDGWTGRWVLIEGDRLRLDATGTLGVFHRRVDGRTWASSSAELLRSIQPRLSPPRQAIAHGRGMDWYPPPVSGIEGIGCLLPSQSMQLGDGTIERRRLLPPVSPRGYDETLDGLGERLVAAFRALRDEDVWVSLTAGNDSRLVLAAAIAAGTRVQAYTIDYPGISRADRDLPPLLAGATGIGHRFIPVGPQDPALLELWDLHTAGHAVDSDRQFFARGQFDELAGAAVAVGGSVFEVGRGYYHTALPAQLPPSPEQTAAVLERELPSARPDGTLAWSRWIHEASGDTLDWRDRFYVEQRVAGWLAGIEQGGDLIGNARIHVANGAAYLAETLSLPASRRQSGVHQQDLVRRLAPSLADFPVNPRGPLTERVTHRLRRELGELGAQPTARSYLAHRFRRYTAKRAAKRL